MHKIAIITHHEHLLSYSLPRYSMIVDSISDWTEVSNEDFQMLKNASLTKEFSVLEQPIDQPNEIKKTVAEYLQYVKAQQERATKQDEARKKAKLAKRESKAAKTVEEKRALLKQLQEELQGAEPDANPNFRSG